MKKDLVLASASRYRHELLSRLAIPFKIAVADIDESPKTGELPQALATRLSQQKAEAVAKDTPSSLIIGSDQVAYLDDHILGKPGEHAVAIEQLKKSSGKTVTFYTGLCLLDTSTNEIQLDCVTYQVQFRKLSAKQIERYLQHEKPYDSAGSFKVEGLGVILFEKMAGDDPTALIGLPLISLTSMLKKVGVELP